MTTATGPLAPSSGSVPTAVIGTSVALRAPPSDRTTTPSPSCSIATEHVKQGRLIVRQQASTGLERAAARSTNGRRFVVAAITRFLDRFADGGTLRAEIGRRWARPRPKKVGDIDEAVSGRSRVLGSDALSVHADRGRRRILRACGVQRVRGE